MKATGIGLPLYATYKQSFNFSSIVLSEISFDKNVLLIITQSVNHPSMQLAQFDTTEQRLSSAEKLYHFNHEWLHFHLILYKHDKKLRKIRLKHQDN